MAGSMGPARLNSAMRFAPPLSYEQNTAAGQANAFTNAVLDLADQQDEIEGPTARAIAITADATILADYIKTVRERTGLEADHDLEEWDDVLPEILKANERVNFYTGVAEGLTEQAKTRLKQAGMENQPLEYVDHAEEGDQPNTRFPKQYWEQRRIAQTACMLGNAAAIEWHIDQMNQLNKETDQEQLGGHILALWTNSENLSSCEIDQSLDGPEYKAATYKRSMAMRKLNKPENLTDDT